VPFIRKKSGEFYASTTNTGQQIEPRIGALPDGGFVVVWESNSGGPIRAQRFDAAGAKVGAEIVVPTNYWDPDPEIAVLPGGEFVVVWTDIQLQGSKYLAGRMYSAAGEAMGETFTVAPPANPGPWMSDPAVFGLPGGGFVTAWQSSGTRAQIYDAARNKVGPELVFNSNSSSTEPFGTPIGTDRFLLVWEDRSLVGGVTDIFYRGQLVDTSGNKIGDVAAYDTDFHMPAATALAGGGYVLVGQSSSRAALIGQRFDANGAAAGAQFEISAQGYQFVDVVALPWGGFMVAFGTMPIYAQLFDSDGSKIGAVTQISTEPLNWENGGARRVDLAVLASGEVAAVWSNESGSAAGQGIKVQLLMMPTFGTAAADEFAGTSGDDAFLGYAGDDRLSGGDGADELSGGDGNDVLTGGDGDDGLHGGGGDDLLVGGAGADRYDGGDGIDTVDYSGETGPVAVNLTPTGLFFPTGHPFATRNLGPGEALDGAGKYETLAGIENLILTAGNDRVVGSESANRIDGGAGNDSLSGSGGDDVLLGGDGQDSLAGGAGDDRLEGGSGNDTLIGADGSDTLIGDAGNDTIVGDAGNDTLSGGDGNDVLRGGAGVDSFDGGAHDAATEAAGVFGDRVSFADPDATAGVVADLRTGIISNDGFGNVETMVDIESLGSDTAFADTLHGNDNRNFLWAGRGDTLYGYGGDDTLHMSAAAALADGGDGIDTLSVDGNGGLIPDNNGDGRAESAPSMTTGWTIDLGAGTARDGYGLNGTIANFENLTGSILADTLRGNSGANEIRGGGGNDTLYLQDGGSDTVNGGSGDDIIFFGAAFDSGDRVDGSTGTDTVVLQGNYASLAFGAASLVGVEGLSLQSGSITRWGQDGTGSYDYGLTMTEENVAAGVQLRVNGQSLLVGEDLAFNGSAETDGGRFLVYAGFGVDTLTGGSGNDIFFFEAGRFGSADKVNGGGGNDALVISGAPAGSSGPVQLTIAAGTFTSVESLSFNGRFASDPNARPSYDVTIESGNVAAGGSLIVNASSLEAGQSLSFTGSAVEDARFRIFGGASGDRLVGGGGDDIIEGGGGGDALTSGSGRDLFVYRNLSDSSGVSCDLITDFHFDHDKIDLSLIDANILAAGNQAFQFIGHSAFSGAAGELRVIFDAGVNAWALQADVNGDGGIDFQLYVVTGAGPPPVADIIL
jgi:Ca2+-binding RTX toxin-like protein